MNTPERLNFPVVVPTRDVVGIQEHEIEAAGHRWAVVEYGPGVGRDEWCEIGHRGYVIEGGIVYEFSDSANEDLVLQAGDGFLLPAGTPHRGRNPHDRPNRLFLIDD